MIVKGENALALGLPFRRETSDQLLADRLGLGAVRSAPFQSMDESLGALFLKSPAKSPEGCAVDTQLGASFLPRQASGQEFFDDLGFIRRAHVGLPLVGVEQGGCQKIS